MRKQGLRPACHLLDVKSVTLQKQELVDAAPMLFVSCATDELLAFTNAKGDVVVGSHDQIVKAHYVFCLTQREFLDRGDLDAGDDAGEGGGKEPEFDARTGGWVIVDWSRGQSK